MTQLYAHYYGTRYRRIVIISTSMSPVGEEIAVKDRAEARKIAAERGAKCWNF